LAAGIVVVLALIAYGLRPTPIVVESAIATRGPMQVTIDEDGVARLRDRYVVSAPLLGSVGRSEWTPGDLVAVGTVLARLAPIAPMLLDERMRRETEARIAMTRAAQSQVSAQVDRAAASFAFAKDDAVRMHTLEAVGAVSRDMVERAQLLERTAASDLASMRFNQQVAEHEVAMARAALAQVVTVPHASQAEFELRSPVAGKVLRVLQKSESVVQPGAPLLEIGEPEALEVVVDVLTSDAVRIQPASVVVLERWGGPDLEGRVQRVEPSAFTRISALGVEEQRVDVIVDVTSAPALWVALGDGYRVEAKLLVWSAQDVLQVPTSAVFRHDADWAVYRVLPDGVASLTAVELGERTPHRVQIARGLAAGDRVALHPSDRVQPGVRVELH
jgi:HlyD family secretion protein